MKSLRTIFSKVAHIPSGSSADRMTYRQREVKVQCSFLRAHIKSREGISNLPRQDVSVYVCVYNFKILAYSKNYTQVFVIRNYSSCKIWLIKTNKSHLKRYLPGMVLTNFNVLKSNLGNSFL